MNTFAKRPCCESLHPGGLVSFHHVRLPTAIGPPFLSRNGGANACGPQSSSRLPLLHVAQSTLRSGQSFTHTHPFASPIDFPQPVQRVGLRWGLCEEMDNENMRKMRKMRKMGEIARIVKYQKDRGSSGSPLLQSSGFGRLEFSGFGLV